MILDAPTRTGTVSVLPVTHHERPQESRVWRTEVSGAGFAGLMVLDLHMPFAQSLKDKRQSLRSVKQRLRDSGMSVSEVDHHDKWQRAQVAVSVVARTSGDVEGALDQALRIFDTRFEMHVSVRQRTVLALEEYEDR